MVDEAGTFVGDVALGRFARGFTRDPRVADAQRVPIMDRVITVQNKINETLGNNGWKYNCDSPVCRWILFDGIVLVGNRVAHADEFPYTGFHYVDLVGSPGKHFGKALSFLREELLVSSGMAYPYAERVCRIETPTDFLRMQKTWEAHFKDIESVRLIK